MAVSNRSFIRERLAETAHGFVSVKCQFTESWNGTYTGLVPTSFGTNLIQRLLDLGLSQNKFALLVKTSSSMVSQVINGVNTPPLKRLDLWLDTLELTGEARDRMELLAYLAHCPPVIERQFLAQEQMIDELTRRVEEVEARAAEPRQEYRAEPVTKPAGRPADPEPKP